VVAVVEPQEHELHGLFEPDRVRLVRSGHAQDVVARRGRDRLPGPQRALRLA